LVDLPWICRRREIRRPFTPFHLGPGLAFKSAGGDRFSFVVFGGAQVLIDVEPGVRLLLGHQYVHGPTHTHSPWLFNLISFHELHLLCIALGVLGGIGYLLRRSVAERKPSRKIRPDLPKS
jgi:hypothetical protein